MNNSPSVLPKQMQLLSREKADATAGLSNLLKGKQNLPNLKLLTGSNIGNFLHNQFNGRRIFFPQRLHSLLQDVELSGKESIVSWQPHGRAFRVHDRKEFVKAILPQYFDHSNILSFHRQLNLYSFRRITFGIDRGAYYHDMFLRDEPLGCQGMERHCIKRNGGRKRYSSSPDPNFYDSVAFSVHLNGTDESVASQPNDIRSENKGLKTHNCDQREDVTATDHQPKLHNVVSFDDITQCEHNYPSNDFPVFTKTRACTKTESESKNEDLTDSSVVNANLLRDEEKAFFVSLSELLKEEIEQESLEANNTARPSYIEADAIYADGGQLNSWFFSESESQNDIGLENSLKNSVHANEDDTLQDDDIMSLCMEDWLI